MRVIIGVAASFVEEGRLSRFEATAQRERIAAMQRDVLDTLGVFASGEVIRFETIPFVSMVLDRAGLIAASGHSSVTSIQEDMPRRRTLTQSESVIGARVLINSGVSGGGTRIAVLDDGMQTSHPALSGATINDACFSTNSTFLVTNSLCAGRASSVIAPGAASVCSSLDPDVCRHGTHVGGIARAISGNSWIIPVQVFSERISLSACFPDFVCTSAFDSDVLRALEYISNLAGPTNATRIAAVNLSLGGGRYVGACDGQLPAYKAIIDTLRSKRIATVIASGNAGYVGALSAPACISTAISVGSYTKADAPTLYSNVSAQLSLGAPGHQIRSSVPFNGYAALDGTSMAAPHVAAAWGILANAFPSRSVAEILAALRTTGRSINDAGYVIPRIQVDAAHRHLLSSTPPPQTPPGRPAVTQAQVVNGVLNVTWLPGSGAAATAHRLDFYAGASLAATVTSGPGTTAAIPVPPGTSGSFTVVVTAMAGSIAGTPSIPFAFTIAGGSPCATPSVLTLTGSVSGGVATVSWTATGASAFIVQAGTGLGATDLFPPTNVGATTSVSATVGTGFRGWVRVTPVNACGVQGAPRDTFIQ